ncbi:class I SAM-dependent methyltransferase [Desulfobacula sp.]|uniref:SAM-dependent methyltransferase n=1 Tax=Desulfobacula sp. TaxID=2593537 RepID=UPI0026127A75|nr:class I SAM-dependent methyltransferase [Desulfobacula sp.]
MIKTVNKLYGILDLLIPELMCRTQLQRKPEPDLLMEREENVKFFHNQGKMDGPLIPIYHFNALATSRLVPLNGTVLDLGSGSGQYLVYLANLRKDITIIGLELSEEMIKIGNAAIEAAGLDDRITLSIGDMTSFNSLIPSNVDVISSIFAFHHLPSIQYLKKCLNELSAAHHQYNCSIWAFDHVRPKLKRTAVNFPEVFTPKSPEKFKRDSTNSLIASFSFAELSSYLDHLFGKKVFHSCSRLMKLYQVHLIESDKIMDNKISKISSASLSGITLKDYQMFRWMFGSVPIDRDPL